MEAERQRVHEAKAELDEQRKMSEDVDGKLSSVSERLDQLSEEAEPLKVQKFRRSC